MIYSDIEKLLADVAYLKKKVCCCGQNFGLTVLSPPVDEPTGDDPTVLGNAETQEIWFWDGDSWETFSSGGSDTNLFNSDLTQDADHTHDAAGFSTVINDADSFKITGTLPSSNVEFSLVNGDDEGGMILNTTDFQLGISDLTNDAQITLLPASIASEVTDGTNTSTSNQTGSQFSFTGDIDNLPVFNVINTGTGDAIYGESIDAIGISGKSTNAVGLNGESVDGVGINAYSANNYAAAISRNSETTNTVVPISIFQRLTLGTADNGIGQRVDFNTQTTTGIRTSNQIISKWTAATDATRTSEFSITGVNSAVTNTLLTISGAGIFSLTQGLLDFANDAAASAGGIGITGLYRNGSVMMIRVA